MKLKAAIFVSLFLIGFFSFCLDIATTEIALSHGWVERNTDAAASFKTIGRPLTYTLCMIPWIIITAISTAIFILAKKSKFWFNSPKSRRFAFIICPCCPGYNNGGNRSFTSASWNPEPTKRGKYRDIT